MKGAAWKKLGLAVMLAVSVGVLPLAATLNAQQPGTPRTETRPMVTDEDDDFPWGLLGLLGLLGLAGLRRRPAVRSFENDPARRP